MTSQNLPEYSPNPDYIYGEPRKLFGQVLAELQKNFSNLATCADPISCKQEIEGAMAFLNLRYGILNQPGENKTALEMQAELDARFKEGCKNNAYKCYAKLESRELDRHADITFKSLKHWLKAGGFSSEVLASYDENIEMVSWAIPGSTLEQKIDEYLISLCSMHLDDSADRWFKRLVGNPGNPAYAFQLSQKLTAIQEICFTYSESPYKTPKDYFEYYFEERREQIEKDPRLQAAVKEIISGKTSPQQSQSISNQPIIVRKRYRRNQPPPGSQPN